MKKLAGMTSAASASASSGVCLNFTVSSEPGVAEGAAFAFLEVPAAGGSFFGAGAEDEGPPAAAVSAAGGFLPCNKQSRDKTSTQ